MANRPDYSNKRTLEKLESFVTAENIKFIHSFIHSSVKGHEPMLYEAQDVVVGPLSIFTM